ncbi:MAG: hypothetical protein R3B98_02215 [Hyphomonas sp.]
MSFLCPPFGFPAHLVPLWPLIWLQVLMLRAAMRAKFGKGVEYHWSVTLCGRVYLTRIDWIPGQPRVPAWAKPALHPNRRIAAALSGELLAPYYVRDFPSGVHPGESRGLGSCGAMPAVLDPGLRRDERNWRGLPLPET